MAELKQIKRRVYDSVSHCAQMLIDGPTSKDHPKPKADDDLFELEFGPLSEMSRFLSWEIMHLQTISDSVADLSDQIAQH